MRRFAAIAAAIFAVSMWAALTHGNDAATQPSAGEIYKNSLYGIQVRLPAGMEASDEEDPEIIAAFTRTDVNWHLKIWRIHSEKSLPLSIHKDQFGQDEDGVMENTLAQLKQVLPGAHVLRNEVINVGKIRVGMLSLRYDTASHDRRLAQEAIVEVPDADQQLFYGLELDSPAKPLSEPDEIENPGERLAYDAFSKMVDSVVLLDRTGVAEDQRQRLYRSEALQVRWVGSHFSMIREAVDGEAYNRIIRDGADVGYQSIHEYLEPGRTQDDFALHIGMVTHLVPGIGLEWNWQAYAQSTSDRMHEKWSFDGRETNPKNEEADKFSQLGSTDEQTKVVRVHLPDTRTGEPEKQAQPEIENVRTMTVRSTHGAMTYTPMQQDTPQFYLPTAYSFLLPRLLPLDRACGYMWAVFVSPAPTPQHPVVEGRTAGHIESRYLDVLPIGPVTFNNHTFDAVTINDRITLDGEITSNYFTPDGKFLGSRTVTKKYGTVDIVPSDAATLKRLWQNPNLVVPGEKLDAPAQ